ncbi:MAG: class I SAM-dependent methyltransferase [Firmicutes bacterium]|nr:class I SAM-dependent methyltransferase [Bacillota bacterium]
MTQDWNDPEVAKQWDENGQESNPVRNTHLAILTALLRDVTPHKATILDIGCGSGQVASRILAAREDWAVVGIDNSSAMMAIASERLAAYRSRMTMITGDLNKLSEVPLPDGSYDAAVAVQSLHHLLPDPMQAAYRWIYHSLNSGGWFFLVDRVQMADASLWPAYQSLWSELDAVHHSTLLKHEGITPEEHEQTLVERGDMPVTVAKHIDWLTDIGFAADVLHAHAHRVLIGARKKQ